MVSRLIAGLLLVASTVPVLLLARQGRSFRRPTEQQARDIADPLARIAVRHLPLEVIGADLADGIDAAIATNAYVTDGPLTEPIGADTGDVTNDGSTQ